MSLTSTISTSAEARRIARQTIKSAAASLTGRQRGPDRKVRRDSFDVDDRRARVFRRIEDGSRAAGLGWIDDLVALAEEFDLVHRKPGERGPLQASGVRVLRILLTRFLRFADGQLDPAVDTIARACGYTYKTVHAALCRLRKHGFLDWVRRTRKVAAEGARDGREQTTNAYLFPFAFAAKGVLQRWRDLRERRRRRRAATPPGTPPAAQAGPSLVAATIAGVADPGLRAVLAGLAAATDPESRRG